MSAICGVFERGRERSDEDGIPSAEASFPSRAVAAMMPELARFGPEGSAVWQRGAVGLGHQMAQVTPESRHETLPWHDPAAALTITAQARLDNRSELCQTFGIPHSERGNWPDGRLILQAYEEWGADCAERLVGDFAFAIWDERRRRLFCCRDHTGVFPFFYHYDGRRFVFASRISAILSVPGIDRRLNRNRVAAMSSTAARFRIHEQTFFTGILSLPSAATLLVDEQGMCQQTYWRPENAPPLPYRSDEDLLEAFRALLTEAVGARLRSAFPVAALLSGGLDSSGVVSIAARRLEEQGQSLLTLSSVLPEQHAPGLSDERDYIDRFRDWSNLVRHYISAPGHGPFDNVESVVRNYESPLISSRHYLYAAFTQVAREAGSRVILDGMHGELGPTFHSRGYYADLLLRLRWHRLWRELSRRSRNESRPLLAVIRSCVVRSLLASLQQAESSPPELQPAFIERHLIREPRDPDESRRWQRPNPYRDQLDGITFLCLKHARGGDGVHSGHGPIFYGLPYRDKRVLEFCLRVPLDLKVRDGYARYLLRAGLDGLLPPDIQWRTTKAPFSPDYYERYRAQRRFAEDYLGAIGPGDPVHEVVAVETLKKLAASENRIANRDTVPSGVYLIHFLRQFAEFSR
jgi:asparagine synthase (glutamine-hydrolysing)